MTHSCAALIALFLVCSEVCICTPVTTTQEPTTTSTSSNSSDTDVQSVEHVWCSRAPEAQLLRNLMVRLLKFYQKEKIPGDSSLNDIEQPPRHADVNGTKYIDDSTCGIPQVKDMAANMRIIGGRVATPGRWPWQVAVLNKRREPFCGGTLITPQFVLTAAHCVRRRLYIRAGEHDLVSEEGSEQEVRVDKYFTHPDYDAEIVDSDIALLRLRKPLKMTKYVNVACLPKPEETLDVESLGTILGWGKQRNTALFGTDVLHQAQVPIASVADCKKVYDDYFISKNMVCAGYKRGRVDSCAGDSGGPLLFEREGQWFVYGITSFGEGCGRKGKFGIYAKVPNFAVWIRETIARRSRPGSRGARRRQHRTRD